MSIKKGDFVKSNRHGHTGRVYDFERLTDADQDWVDMQTIPLTVEDLQGRFIRILIHDGGAVSVPESSCTKIKPIKEFWHPYANEHFGK